MFKNSKDYVYKYHERAAILEFDANMERAEANRLALNEVYEEVKLESSYVTMAAFISAIIQQGEK